MSKIPDRLFIEEKDKELYDKLLEKGSPLSRENGFENKDLFLIAMCLGYEEGVKLEINKRLGYFLSKYLSREDMAILYSIAVEENGIDALKDIKGVYNLAEDYATSGIRTIYDGVFSGPIGSYQKRFESILIRKFLEIKDEYLTSEE